MKKPPSDGGKGGKRPRNRVAESDSSDDSVAQIAAGVPIKEFEEVSAIEKIIAPTMDEESVSTEDSDAGKHRQGTTASGNRRNSGHGVCHL